LLYPATFRRQKRRIGQTAAIGIISRIISVPLLDWFEFATGQTRFTEWRRFTGESDPIVEIEIAVTILSGYSKCLILGPFTTSGQAAGH
jgi:hypothetical protein